MSRSAQQRLLRAGRHPVARRREVLRAFFTRWPATTSHPLGLGRALVAFQEWEIESGRLHDEAGSPWWSAVNGCLVSDIEDAAAGAPGPWTDYIVSLSGEPDETQAALWAAHQRSIHEAVDAATALFDAEPAEEQEFARLAIAVVDTASTLRHRTSSGGLGSQTREHYPKRYPCGADDLERVRRMLDGRTTQRR